MPYATKVSMQSTYYAHCWRGRFCVGTCAWPIKGHQMEPALIASVGLVVSLISGLVSDNVLPRIVAALSRRQAQKRTQEQFGDFNVRVETSGVWWRNEPVVRVETREAARGPRAGLRLSDADRGELTRQFREALRQELRKEGRRTFWLGFLQGAFFFALGVGATLLIS